MPTIPDVPSPATTGKPGSALSTAATVRAVPGAAGRRLTRRHDVRLRSCPRAGSVSRSRRRCPPPRAPAAWPWAPSPCSGASARWCSSPRSAAAARRSGWSRPDCSSSRRSPTSASSSTGSAGNADARSRAPGAATSATWRACGAPYAMRPRGNVCARLAAPGSGGAAGGRGRGQPGLGAGAGQPGRPAGAVRRRRPAALRRDRGTGRPRRGRRRPGRSVGRATTARDTSGAARPSGRRRPPTAAPDRGHRAAGPCPRRGPRPRLLRCGSALPRSARRRRARGRGHARRVGVGQVAAARAERGAVRCGRPGPEGRHDAADLADLLPATGHLLLVVDGARARSGRTAANGATVVEVGAADEPPAPRRTAARAARHRGARRPVRPGDRGGGRAAAAVRGRSAAAPDADPTAPPGSPSSSRSTASPRSTRRPAGGRGQPETGCGCRSGSAPTPRQVQGPRCTST